MANNRWMMLLRQEWNFALKIFAAPFYGTFLAVKKAIDERDAAPAGVLPKQKRPGL